MLEIFFEGESFLMCLVDVGYIIYIVFKDGLVDLVDVVCMNDWLDLKVDNEYCIVKWREDNEC